MTEAIEEMGINDLPNESLKFAAEECGLDVVKKLMEKCPGLLLSIPQKPGSAFTRRYVLRHYNGENTLVIARKLGISRRYVEKILASQTRPGDIV